MISSNRIVSVARSGGAGAVLDRVPQRSFGDTAWVMLALAGYKEHLAPAIASRNPRRIANAVRAIAHTPTLEQLDDVVGAACDAALEEAYAVRDTRVISNVTAARSVIGTVVAELRERTERDAMTPAVLRETVDGYVQIVALLNQRMAERLDAVGRFAMRIGSAMHLPPSAVLEIELAGRLHDIGTLSVPAANPATDALAGRPTVGESFLRSVPSLAHLAPIVRSHRERFDGRGYPDGLSGAEIPLASRIISVAAAFVDSMTESPTRTNVLANDACHELLLYSGTRFDPDVVTATLHLLRFRRRTNRSA